MSFEDNSPVIALIEGSSPSGIMPMLAEECFFPKGSDESWHQKLRQAHAKHPAFSLDLKGSRSSFTIAHYPGKVRSKK